MLALIAGRGSLPATVAAAQNVPPLVTSLLGNAPDRLAVDITFRIEQLGSFLEKLTDRGVREVCFCGMITRPAIDPSMIDARTMPLVPVLAGAVASGEDSALRAVLSIFEDAGFAVRGADELAPSLLPAASVLTKTPVPKGVADQLALAAPVLALQGKKDIGQACVIRGNEVIAHEDSRGTDAMLADMSETYTRPEMGGGDPLNFAVDLMGEALDGMAEWLSEPVTKARATAQGGVLIKAPKPDQERRVDLPTIGPGTAMRAAEAGLDGIVIAAGGVMVLDRAQVVAILDEMGMYLWVH
ncbi:LpxI family protein [Tateyamaria sp.]|uniref:LpxI family protein n=1 Tax=Tateyamaria sp. TaxID=1929288 RepID=UPI00329AB286